MARKPTAKRIEVNIEGFPEDGGAVRFDALFNFLAEVKRTLAAVEREVTDSDRTVLAYKVVTLTYASPIRCVLEPIVPKTSPRLGNIVAVRLGKDIQQIKAGAPQSKRKSAKPVGPAIATLEQFEKLAVHRVRSGNFSIGLENESVPITSEFDEKVKKLLGNIYKSHGTFRGKLEAVNIHSSPCIVQIFPVIGPAKIRCTYPKGRFPTIGDYLGHTVDVSGIVKYRGDEPHPYEIEIETITLVKSRPEQLIASSLVGCMPGLTQGKDITSYLSEIRND